MDAQPSGPDRRPSHDRFFEALVGALPEAAVVTDAAHDVLYVNPAFTAMTGYSFADVRGRNCRLLQGPDTDRETVRAIRQALDENSPFRGRILNHRKDGTPFWNELALAPVGQDVAEYHGHFVALERDVTGSVADRARLVELLEQTERERATLGALLDTARSLAREVSTPKVLRSVAEALPRLCEADRSGVAVWDPSAARLRVAAHAGWPDRLVEQIGSAVVSPSDSPELAEIVVRPEPVLVRRGAGSEWAHEVLARYEIEAFAAIPVRSRQELQGLLLVYWVDGNAPDGLDDTLRIRLSGLARIAAIALDNARLVEQSSWSAAHDPLTGLPNRTVIEERLARALEGVSEQATTAVIYCDVDGLKRTNDAMGHDVGDAVLVEVAGRLRASLRPADTVSRVGGDEFVIVLDSVGDESEAQAILARLEAALAVPVRIGERLVPAGLSMGLAVRRDPLGDLSPADAGRALLQAADLAMYQRKARRLGNPSGISSGRFQRLADDLRGAAARGEISVRYQPQVDLSSRRIVAVEALARWQHPALGVVQPDEFIPIAEMTGEIGTIGLHVLRLAAADVVRLRRRHPELQLSVNVSNDELEQPGFAERVEGTLAEAGLPAKALTLEITESTLPKDRGRALGQLIRLHALGVGISLDDFGTGYTSLAQLRDMPVTELKVDRLFVHVPAPHARDLLAGVAGFARRLGLRTVAEGLSDEDDVERVRAAGFDCAQGFVLAPPMDLHDLAHRLEAGDG